MSTWKYLPEPAGPVVDESLGLEGVTMRIDRTDGYGRAS